METKKLCRSTKDKKLSGVCGGIAEYFGFDSTFMRLAFILSFFLCGIGFWAYIICAIVMPQSSNE